jgi:hypothetical protein
MKKKFDSNYKGKKIIDLPPDMEGVTRPDKDAKTKKFMFLVRGVGVSPMKLSIFAENKTKAMQYAKARWNDCKLELVK